MTADLLDHPVIAERYFFPRPERFADPCWVEVAEAQLACYSRRRHAGAKTLVHFHGNGETVVDYLDGFVEAVDAIGLNLFLAEFRGYGMSTGSPSLGRMLDDVAPLIRAVGCPVEEMVLFGRSVGSLFAIHGVSLFPEVAGLILESAVADPLERLLLRVAPWELGCTAEDLAQAVAERLDHRGKMAAYQRPLLVMHTRNDDLVEVSHGERLHRWAGGKKQLHIFPRGNHNNILAVNAREYFSLIENFVQAP
ncbi:alpha/beta hydrolase [Desulfuromonas acetexigens]|uniref:Alpha/beta hydrolase n=1 Tax=Trichloromonas acetexigens TaxID=38815 RepID=A0A550JIX8_9BACT|nr:alpha/beta hydrolase [Desulfuromonas acetexigens]TRO83165.1 alpha/beta hydrolase [Desulfuromonas acetexigens]